MAGGSDLASSLLRSGGCPQLKHKLCQQTIHAESATRFIFVSMRIDLDALAHLRFGRRLLCIFSLGFGLNLLNTSQKLDGDDRMNNMTAHIWRFP